MLTVAASYPHAAQSYGLSAFSPSGSQALALPFAKRACLPFRCQRPFFHGTGGHCLPPCIKLNLKGRTPAPPCPTPACARTYLKMSFRKSSGVGNHCVLMAVTSSYCLPLLHRIRMPPNLTGFLLFRPQVHRRLPCLLQSAPVYPFGAKGLFFMAQADIVFPRASSSI